MAKVNFYIDKLNLDNVYTSDRKSKVGNGTFSFNSARYAFDTDMAMRFNEVIVSLSDINGLNIIINDEDCSNSFFDEVVSLLRENGVKFASTSNCVDINCSDSVIVSIDQQYNLGTEPVVFAPYNNTRLGSSDALAISMQKAFCEQGIAIKDIPCGQFGFHEDLNGKVSYTSPTATEEAIDDDKDTSFVTISLGTNKVSASDVAKSIEGGLARYYSYLQEYDTKNDLIYRASDDDSIEVVAEYFQADVNDLKKANGISEDIFRNSQTILNPNINRFDVFNDKTKYLISGCNEKSL